MKRITMLAVAALLVTGIAYGADEPAPNYKHLKPLEWLVGEWVVEFEAPEDAPADSPIAVKKGDPLRITSKYEWGLNKNVIKHQMAVLMNDELLMASESTIGWAVDKTQVIGSGFNTLGGRGESVFTVVDDKSLKVNVMRISSEDEVRKETVIVKMIDKDTVTSQAIDRTVNGEQEPDDEEPVTWKRMK
jgi:hypothetical protein